MAEDGKVSRLELLIAWVRRWGRFARVARVAARNPLGRRIGVLLLVPFALLVLVVVVVVRVLTG
ncbi:hypothetical protein [Myceligenerans xiligouense]|uniref:Uncharacterized protein n=1 Tax=Myceligenerans xiligouense TaxID=253184 RepID=A0A3N4YNT3_9MICO|nr:hypothetical protein [Myceligenerans xiligouense]RPF21024.1 hypothetical protein EDD34_1633 [Myceligenerans xiligouense]